MKILRARVIEGTLPVPEALRAQNPGMTENNYELSPALSEQIRTASIRVPTDMKPCPAKHER